MSFTLTNFYMKFKQRHFVHKNPIFGRTKKQQSAMTYEYNNVYWFLFEFLKRSEEYKKVCKSKGQSGSANLKKLYQDFGDIHSMTFQQWWGEKNKRFGVYSRGAYLFAEQTDYVVREITNTDDLFIDDSVMNVQIPLSMSKREISKLFHTLLRNKHKGTVGRRKSAHEHSTAIYKIQGRVELDALKKCLMVYDAYEQNRLIRNNKEKQNEVLKLWEIGNNKEIVPLQKHRITKDDPDYVNKRRYLASLVDKLHKRALKLIKNAETGVFPNLLDNSPYKKTQKKPVRVSRPGHIIVKRK